MGIPSSGQISMLQIANETGLRPVNISLRDLSQIAGFSTPDYMSDFYSYSQTDAQRYKNAVNNSGYTLNGTEESAVDALFTDLNNSGLLGKIYAFYPMLGYGQGQAINAKSEGDVRQWQYDLTFNGAWSFGAYGATGDGSSTYWTANYSYPTTTDLKDSHLGTYLTSQGTYDYGWDMGVFDASNFYPYALMSMYEYYSGAALYDYDYSDGIVAYQPANYKGNSTMTYDNITSKIVIYQNGNQFAKEPQNVESYSTTTMVAGGYDYSNNTYTDKTFGFITFGKRLNATEMTDYQTHINTFQTTLGRNTY